LEAGYLGCGAGAETPLIPDFVECLTRKLALQRPGFNISAACASATVAVAQACMRIASGNTEAALVVCADLVTEFVFSGFSALQILSDRPCTPFDRNRNGLSLGEGAAVICLMSPRRARMEGLLPQATLCGWGIAGDAAHITAPDRAGQGLIRAVRHAFRAAGCDPEEIAAVNAHGTGTVHNDRMELNAFRTLFGGRKIFIHSVKGGIGHTLGAAGGIELALSVKSLQENRIPPTIGLSDPEPRGEGHIFSDPLALPPGCLLATNSGFGGVNAALIIDKGKGP
jgi:3-oxoacyl-[acyl-carrier-protein] synthase II